LANAAAQQGYDQNKYNQMMSAWAANRTAEATERAS